MRVEIKPNKKKTGFFTVIPYGPIDSDSHDNFRQSLEKLLVKTTHGILVDLKNVDYISSAGFGVLFTIQKFLKKQAAELLFCNLKPQIQKLFDVMKVLPSQNIFNSIEEADAYLLNIVKEEIKKQQENN
mgnify:FL=1